jgi:hypothetical protein
MWLQQNGFPQGVTLVTRVEPGHFGQLFPSGALFFREAPWHFDLRNDYEVPFLAGPLRQAALAHPQLLTAAGSGRDADVYATIQRRDGDVRSEHGFPGRQVSFVDEIVFLYLKVRVLGQTDPKVEVTSDASRNSFLPATGDSQPLSFADSRWDLHLVSVLPGDVASAAADLAIGASAPTGAGASRARLVVAHGNGANGPPHRFLQSYHDVAFEVLAPFRKVFLAESAVSKAATPRASTRAE